MSATNVTRVTNGHNDDGTWATDDAITKDILFDLTEMMANMSVYFRNMLGETDLADGFDRTIEHIGGNWSALDVGTRPAVEDEPEIPAQLHTEVIDGTELENPNGTAGE